MTSTLLGAACVADLSDGPDSGTSAGSGGRSGTGLGGDRGGTGGTGGDSVTGAGGARTAGGGGNGAGGAVTGGGGRTGGGGSGLGGTGVGGRGTAGSGPGGSGLGGSGLGGSGVGGRGVGGSGMGGSGVGGAVATACSNVGPSASGNGEYTFYSFGQGTSPAQEGGGFRTACGYFGTEPGGATGDTVQNIVNPQYFAAIPGTDPNHFNTNNQCGACIQVTYNGRSLIGTIIDECPENLNAVCQRNPTGELDLSVPLADALGFGPGSGQNGNPTGQTWKVVPCPTVGNLKVRVKTGNPNEVFIENTILAIKSVSVNGAQATHSFYGTWQLPVTSAAGQTLTLTDAGNRTVTITVNSATPNLNQDTGKQFPSCQ